MAYVSISRSNKPNSKLKPAYAGKKKKVKTTEVKRKQKLYSNKLKNLVEMGKSL